MNEAQQTYLTASKQANEEINEIIQNQKYQFIIQTKRY